MARLRYIHPFLFALTPVFSLAVNNLGQVSLRSFIEAVAAVLILTLFIYAVVMVLSGSWNISALITSLCIVLFMSYGHAENILRPAVMPALSGLAIGRHTIGIHSILMPLWLVFFCLALLWIGRHHAQMERVHGWATRVGLVLVTLAALLFLTNKLRGHEIREPDPWTGMSFDLPQSTSVTAPLPDIYYIILDGYAPAHTLKKILPQSPPTFIEDDLRQRGFFVAGDSQANYVQTFLSLPAALNFNYMSKLPGAFEPTHVDPSPAHRLTRHSLLFKILQQHGYRYVHFSSGWQATFENPEADRNIAYPWQLRRFHRALAETTMLKPFMYIASNYFYRQALVYNFEHLKDMPSAADRPLFVFAHIVAPHPPYVFDADCQAKVGSNSWQPVEEYGAMTQCVRSQTLKAVDSILKNSTTEPIIIIQSDHGSKTANQFVQPYEQLPQAAIDETTHILNAYHFPGGKTEGLYDSISPVNSWRVVLNTYLGTNLELLPDRTFWSETYSPYRFIEVTP